MKKLKYLLFLLIIFLVPNVFAQDVDVTSYCYSNTGYPRMYNGDEVQYQTYSAYNFGTTYQYQLSSFTTELRYNLLANTNYTLTFNANDDDFRNNFKVYRVYDLNNNNNDLITSFLFVGYRKIQVNFKTTTATDKVKIVLGANNVYEAITGEVNWNIKNAVLTVPDTPPEEPSGGASNQDIIDNNFQNTQDIINNNNSNTQDIINNNNSNTAEIKDTIKDSLTTCRDSNNLIDKSDLTVGYIDSSGGLHTGGGSSYTTNIIDLGEGSFTVSNAYVEKLCYYNDNGIFNNCITSNNPVTQLEYTFTLTSFKKIRLQFRNANLGDLMLNKGSISLPYEPYGEICSNKLDDTTNAINDVNDTLNNSNVESGTGSDFFDNFTSQDFGLSQIVTIPLNTIQSLTSKTCVPLQVPIPFTNSNVSLPCMTEIYENKFSSIYNLWKIVSFGIVAYLIAIDIFHIVKGFKDPESDKVEVLDL